MLYLWPKEGHLSFSSAKFPFSYYIPAFSLPYTLLQSAFDATENIRKFQNNLSRSSGGVVGRNSELLQTASRVAKVCRSQRDIFGNALDALIRQGKKFYKRVQSNRQRQLAASDLNHGDINPISAMFSKVQ